MTPFMTLIFDFHQVISTFKTTLMILTLLLVKTPALNCSIVCQRLHFSLSFHQYCKGSSLNFVVSDKVSVF